MVFPPGLRRMAQAFLTQLGRRAHASALLVHLRDHAPDPALAPSREHISSSLTSELEKWPRQAGAMSERAADTVYGAMAPLARPIFPVAEAFVGTTLYVVASR